MGSPITLKHAGVTHRAKPVLAREAKFAHALPEARPDQALHQEAELDAWQEVPIVLCTAHYQLQHAHIQSVVQITRISSRAASLGCAGNAPCTMQQWVTLLYSAWVILL